MTVVTEDGSLLGVFTDGDLRRALEEGNDIKSATMTHLMTRDVKTLPSGHLAAEAMHIMERNKISSLVVVEGENKVAGVVHLMAMLKAGLS